MTHFESPREREVSEGREVWLQCSMMGSDGRITHMYLSSDSRRTRMSRILSILKSSPSMSSTVTDESAMETMSSCPGRHRTKPHRASLWSWVSTLLESIYISLDTSHHFTLWFMAQCSLLMACTQIKNHKKLAVSQLYLIQSNEAAQLWTMTSMPNS